MKSLFVNGFTIDWNKVEPDSYLHRIKALAKMEHSEAASILVDIFISCKSTCRKASDHKQRQENRRSRRRNLVNACNEDEGCPIIDRQKLQSKTVKTCLYREER